MIAHRYAHPVIRPLSATVGAAIIFGQAIVALSACNGCTPGEARAVSYGGELESCLQRYDADNCDEYLECRHNVQAQYGMPITGTCDAGVDAGVDGGAL